MTTRVYLPLTSAELTGFVEARRLEGPRSGHAVTARLRTEWPEGDDEEWEYAAMQAAGVESWQMPRGGGDRRRVVLVADVAATEPDSDSDELTGVRVEHDVVWKHVAAAHVDTEDLPDGLGSDELEDRQLAWFATQEIPDLML